MKIALIGYGKMGKAIEQTATGRGHSIVLRIDENNRQEFTPENLSQADVAIEFTGPHSAFDNLKALLKNHLPTVCGSTGWLSQQAEILQTCKDQEASFLYASNFSVGVNIFFEINKHLAALMASHPEYEPGIGEIHHTQKKDAPSGTAITLAEQILNSIERKKTWINEPLSGPDELVILSERTDPAPGTHKVKYSSTVDDIEIIHTAHSRQGFALGAVLAAEFIQNKKGIFSMKEVLGF